MPGAYMILRSQCPCCQSNDLSDVCSYPYSDHSLIAFLKSYYRKFEPDFLEGACFTVKECNQCGLFFQQEIPDSEFLKVLYDKWLARPEEVAPLSTRIAHELHAVSCHLRVRLNHLKVLDFGMGSGQWYSVAQALGCETYGHDLADSLMVSARSRGVQTLTWSEIGEHQFDFISTDQVLEHLADPYETLTQLSRGLKRSGVLKICVPNGSRLRERLRRMDWMAPLYSRNSLNVIHPLEHINCYTRASLIAAARVAGLVPIRPSFYCQYSFVWKHRLEHAASEPIFKSLLRPIYTPFNPHALYLWFRRLDAIT